MQWTREQVVQHLTPPPGIVMPPYPKERDRLYRTTLVAITLGFFATALFTYLKWPRAVDIAHGWVALSVFGASLSFLVWISSWRHLVRALAVLGILLWPWWSLGSWAALLASTAIMAAKETHCFHFGAGKILPWYSLALGFALIAPVPLKILAVGWLALAGLWGWLAWARHRLPLFEI
jgi:hypothetical protein